MNEFIKKLIERLEEYKIKRSDDSVYGIGVLNGYAEAIEIVNQLAEEYINCSTDTSIDCSTNADRIRAMSDEELAEWLATIDHYWDDGECVVAFGDSHIHDTDYSILEWLKSEVK